MTEVKIDLAEWMTQLPIQLKDIPIINLAIPGKNEAKVSAILKYIYFMVI